MAREGMHESLQVMGVTALAGAVITSGHNYAMQHAINTTSARIERQHAIRRAQISAEAANAERLAEALRQERLENARLRRLLEQRQAYIEAMHAARGH